MFWWTSPEKGCFSSKMIIPEELLFLFGAYIGAAIVITVIIYTSHMAKKMAEK